MPNTVETWLESFPHLLVYSLILDTEEIFSTVSSSYNTFEDFYCLFSDYSSATVAAHGPWDADNEPYQHFPLKMMSKRSEDYMEKGSEKLSGGEGLGILLGASSKL